MNESIPPSWGKDSLSEFIDTARNNSFATFVNCSAEYDILKSIDDIYRYAIDSLANSPDWFAVFFLLKSHSSYLGSAMLSVSGQCAECYMTLRGCIEAALYGLYLSRHRASCKTWLQRHNDENSLKLVKNEFKIRNLFNDLKIVDSVTHKAVKTLYDRTINYGAHPNEAALTSLLNKTQENNIIQFNLSYLSGNTPAFYLALKTTAQVGVCSLLIFKNVFSERFAILGIDKKIDIIKEGL